MILSLAVATAAPEMPECIMVFREQAEARLNAVILIAGFKKVLITLLNQNDVNV